MCMAGWQAPEPSAALSRHPDTIELGRPVQLKGDARHTRDWLIPPVLPSTQADFTEGELGKSKSQV